MQIKKIRIENFQGCEKTLVNFIDKISIIKSKGKDCNCLSNAIKISLIEYLRVFAVKGCSKPLLEYKKTASEKEKSKIDLTMSIEDIDSVITTKIDGVKTHHSNKELKKYAKEKSHEIMNGDHTVVPVIAFYNGENINGDVYNPKFIRKSNRQDGYKDAFNAGEDYTLLMQWLLKRTIQEIQHKEKIYSLQAVKDTLSKAFNCLLGVDNTVVNFNIKESEIEFQYKLDGIKTTVPLSALNSSQKSFLLTVSDIACRAAILNPWLSESAVDETFGIIFIEHAEILLEGIWNKDIVKILTSLFPNMQIILID